jgi:hypothetical protein
MSILLTILMYLCWGIILLIPVGMFIFWLFSVGDGNKKFRKAKILESAKRYKEACYEYAIAILNGSIFSFVCKKRIKYLWSTHGPFNYDDVLAEMNKTDATQNISCGVAGHAATMSIIKEIIE